MWSWTSGAGDVVSTTRMKWVAQTLTAAALVSVTACGSAQPGDAQPAPPPPIAVGETTASEPVNAQWRYHPRELAEMHDGWQLADGSWLLVGELGERWRTEALPRDLTRRPKPARRYHASASVHRAPEQLRGVVQWSAKRWLFVGQSGRLYPSNSAMGPLSSAITPPVPLRSVAGSSRGLVGLGALGGLHRFDGEAWQVNDDSSMSCGTSCAGCSVSALCSRVFDVAATPAGHMLALALPEALLESRDGGESWSKLAVDSFGAHALIRSNRAGVLAVAPHLTRHYRGDGNFEPGIDVPVRALPDAAHVDLRAVRGPRAIAIAEGRATLSDDHYFEVFDATGDGPGAGWSIASGKLDGTMRTRRLALPSACDDIRVGARDRHVVLACLRDEDPDDEFTVTLFRSSNRGKSFQRGAAARGRNDTIKLTVAPNGDVLMGGVCEGKGKTVCTPRAPLRLAATANSRIVISTAADLTGPATAVTFALDGGSAYFFGRRAKDNQFALFVSHDAGRNFSSRALNPPRGKTKTWKLDSPESLSIHPGAEGDVGLVFGATAPRYALATRDGSITAIARLPTAAKWVSGAGRAVFAVGRSAPAGGALALAAWESRDGGLSFSDVELPMRLEVDEFREKLGVRCSVAGCIVGSRLTRLGWDASDDAPRVSAPREMFDAQPQPAVRLPISCALDDAAGWRSLRHVGTPLLPSASQAMRGRAVWSAVVNDNDSGKVVAHAMHRGKNKTREQLLLPPARDRAAVAQRVARQMEGYAAVRAFTGKRRGNGARTARLDAAWVNYMTDTQGRASLPASAVIDDDDITPGARPFLITGVLSVSPRALVLRHSDQRDSTWVFGLDGKLTLSGRYRNWPAITMKRSRSDAVVAGGTPFAVGMHYPNEEAYSTLSLARLDGQGAARFVTIAPAWRDDRIVDTHWTYHGDEVGIAVHVIDTASQRGFGQFVAFTKDGQLAAPIAVPTQLDLPSPAKPCSDEERRSTPRIVAPLADGTRHPLLVTSTSGNLILISGRTIVHGTPVAPCVAAWHATTLTHNKLRMSAIVSGDLRDAWLFRATPGIATALDYRAMKCKLDPNASVPVELWREKGTVVR
jgi:hypothetical protein